MRTMVIAGKAGEAILVMQPFRVFSMSALDIAYRTDVGTDATLHALVFLYMEPLVGDEHLFEETAHNLGEEPGDRTFYQPVHALFPVEISSQITASSCADFDFLRTSRSFGSTSMKGSPT